MTSNYFQRVFAAILAILCVAFALAFSIGKDVQQLNRQGDAALFEQIIENIHADKGPVSNVFANTQNFIDKGYVFASIGELVERDLTPPFIDERNMLKFHAYFILFALAPFLDFVQSSLLLTIAQSLCFFGLVVSVAVLVFRETSSISVAALMSGVVLSNLNWIGGLLGQFYPDRLFVLAGFLVCWLAWKRGFSIALVIAALLTAIINERAALIAGIAIIGCVMSHAEVGMKRPRTWPWSIIALGMTLLVYAYLEKTYGLDNLYYGGSYLPNSVGELSARLSDPNFQHNIGIFFSKNAILILLSLAAPRLALLSMVVMIPNLIGNIGGAEKIGWLTHYHSYYFPVLVFSASIGTVRIYTALQKRARLSIPIAKTITVIMFVAGALLVLNSIVSKKDELSLVRAMDTVLNSYSDWRNGRSTGYAIRSKARSMFLADQQVLTTEVGMALLHDHVRIGVFPVAVDQADAVFIPCDWLNQGPPGYGRSPDEFGGWLQSKGYDTSASRVLEEISYCAMHRIGHESAKAKVLNP